MIEGAVDVLVCNTPSTAAVNAGQRINATAGCATSAAGVRTLPRDDIPQSPDSAGPSDRPGAETEGNNNR